MEGNPEPFSLNTDRVVEGTGQFIEQCIKHVYDLMSSSQPQSIVLYRFRIIIMIFITFYRDAAYL